MVKQPGWDLLVNLWTKQIQSRKEEIGIKPIISMEEALKRNLQIGVVIGLSLALKMPTSIVNSKADEIDRLLEEIRDATANDSFPS